MYVVGGQFVGQVTSQRFAYRIGLDWGGAPPSFFGIAATY